MKKILPLILAATLLAATMHAEPITVLTSGGRLLTIDSAAPQTVTKTLTVTGLDAGDALVSIDYRPATGGLFGLGKLSRLYSINAETGAATAVGAAGAFALSGANFDADFNPTVDRIRIVSDTKQNLRANANDGTLSATDTSLAYAATDVNTGKNPTIVGAAYTNSFSTALQTILYGIDSTQDTLVIQNPPNAGTLNTVGPLGVDTSDAVGFDISGTTGVPYAALTVAGVAQLYTINLLSGAATVPTGATAPAAIAPTTLGVETVVDIAAAVNPGSRVLNIATRGRVGTGADVLIGGFIVRTGVNSRILIRAIGPSITASDVVGPLADPTLTLYDKNGIALATNDNWMSDQQADITATGLAPTNATESAILTRLVPGDYTAVVSGKGSNTGVATVEIYQLP